MVWRILGRAWFFPSLTIALTAMLATVKPDLPNRSLLCSSVPLVCDEAEVRSFLGLVWQVEGAALALTVAAALFALESAARVRPTTGMADYAEKSRVVHFVLLGTAGLLCVGLILLWTPGLPPPAASAFALLVALSTIALFPAFVARLLRVVSPEFFRRERLRDIQRAVDEQVRADALALAAINEFQEWSSTRGIGLRLFSNKSATPIEVARSNGQVYDIDLRHLARLAQETDIAVEVYARVGEAVSDGDVLLSSVDEVAKRSRAVATLVSRSERELLAEQLQALHEEGLEAIRNGSPAAAAEVAEAYVALLMSWPRAWGQFGQRIDRGLLGARSVFGSSPVGQITRHLYFQAEQASASGSREHVFALMSIPWRTTAESMPLRAVDLIIQMNELVRGFAGAGRESAMADLLANKAWTYHVELCEFHVGRHLENEAQVPEDLAYWTNLCKHFLASAAHLMRDFWDRRQFDQLDEFLRRSRKLLEHIGRGGDIFRAQATLRSAGADATSVSPDQLAQAEAVIALHRALEDLKKTRAGHELALLGWMLHRATGSSGAELRDRAIRYALNLTDNDALVASVGDAMDGPLSQWLMFEAPSNEAHFLDVETPLFTALALALTLRHQPGKRIPPSEWMTEGRIDRLSSLVAEVADWDLDKIWLGGADHDLSQIADSVKAGLANALRDQAAIEDQALIQQPFDEAKVDSYIASVAEGWRSGRLVDAVVKLGRSHVASADRVSFGDGYFGFPPRLIPKGLFVSPTNWVGLDHTGEDIGRQLASSEVGEIVGLITNEAAAAGTSEGSPAERVRHAIAELSTDGFEPSIVLTHFDWRLAQELGLAPWESDEPAHEILGYHVKGTIDGVPVIEWSDVPDHHLYVVDLHRFCRVEEARRSRYGEPEPPTTTVEPIDESRADQIIAEWGPESDADGEASRRRRVLTSVRTETFRHYRVKLLDSRAARRVVVGDLGE